MSDQETSASHVPQTVLVTGGTGFLGTYLCRALAADGRRTVAVSLDDFTIESRFVLGDTAESVEYVHADICNQAKMRSLIEQYRPDAIIHTAAAVGPEFFVKDLTKAYGLNIFGTLSVLEAARLGAVAKTILVSSNSVYHLKGYEPIDEAHPITSVSVGNPAGHYGTSKMAAEQIGLVYSTFHSMDVIGVRLASIYGFGMRAPIYIKPLVEGATRGEPVSFADGGPMKRDYTYVDDCVAGLIAALDKDTRSIKQRIFNMSAGQTVTVNQIAAAVRAQIPDAQITVGDSLNEVDKRNILQRAPLSNEAAKTHFGYTPSHNIEAGIRAYIHNLRAYDQATSTHRARSLQALSKERG